MSGPVVLSVDDLAVSFRTEEGTVRAVNGLSFEVRRDEVVAIVGESGSGKSVSALTLMGLTRGHDVEVSGRAQLGELELIGATDEDLRGVRGRRLAMIFQDPMSSLNPVYRVGEQISEQILAHTDVGEEEASGRAVELLGEVGIPKPRERARAFPHELSGGMRQRVMIAMALSLEPDLLIADEPTTALDVTIQAQILALLRRLNEKHGLATLLITHDLGVVADIADRVIVMYGGRVVESGSLDQVFYEPQHPYTWGLLGSIPRLDRPRGSRLAQIKGQPPSPLRLPQGCHFRPRCPHEFEQCRRDPSLEARGGEGSHTDRCVLPPEQKRKQRRAAEGGPA